jgi:formamidopyrimidine-DNA glycosylase
MRPPGTKIPPKRGLAAFDFPTATFLLTEEGTQKRASIHLVRGEAALAAHGRGGLSPSPCRRPRWPQRCGGSATR